MTTAAKAVKAKVKAEYADTARESGCIDPDKTYDAYLVIPGSVDPDGDENDSPGTFVYVYDEDGDANISKLEFWDVTE